MGDLAYYFSEELVHRKASGQKHTKPRRSAGVGWLSTGVLRSDKSSRGIPATQKMESLMSHLLSPKGVAGVMNRKQCGDGFQIPPS